MKKATFLIYTTVVLFISCSQNDQKQEAALESYFINKEYSSFLQEVDNYIKKNGENSKIDVLFYKKAIANTELGELTKAINDIDKAIEKNNQEFEYYLLKGQIVEKLYLYEQALSSYLMCIKLNENCDKALNNRGFIFMNHYNNFDDARLY